MQGNWRLQELRGDFIIAMKHFMMSASGGSKESLDAVCDLFMQGKVSKADYEQVLRSYQTYRSEVQIKPRDRAMASKSTWAFGA